ncbi:MAG: CvpA family protein [Clostridia bacterium]|nr:CvpA family protein [Clostridia bacterium]
MLADIGAVAVVVIFIAIGYKSGLMKSLISIVSYVLSIILSFWFYPIVSGWLKKTAVYTYLVDLIGKKYMSEGGVSAAVDGIRGLSDFVETASTNISEALATMVINILAFLLVLVFFKIAIRLIGKTLNIFTKLPVIKQFNRLGGAVLGGGIGIVVLYIIFAVLVLLAPFDENSKVMTEVNDSAFASQLYENNVILDFISKGE